MQLLLLLLVPEQKQTASMARSGPQTPEPRSPAVANAARRARVVQVLSFILQAGEETEMAVMFEHRF